MNTLHIPTIAKHDIQLLYRLGVRFLLGQGVEQDLSSAVTLFRAGAEHDDADALVALGSLYQNGQGVPKDFQRAYGLFFRAATKGHMVAQFNLGYCCETGEGTSKDLQEAVHWYSLAAAQGDEAARLALEELSVLAGGFDAATNLQDIRENGVAIAAAA